VSLYISKCAVLTLFISVSYEDPSQITEDNAGGDQEYPCVLHATDGKSRTIATHVTSSALTMFHAHYGTLLKSTMTQSLRKRDKKKEKAKLEALAAKKKKIAEGVIVAGPKRGNGRRKRVRLEKAKKRLDEARKREKGP
jgi:signal recognition particle subunit SRP14